MARIRTIKPEFPHSESMGRVSREARLCFILLWTIADDAGRLRGNSRMLASLLFPYDDDAKKHIDGWLDQLSSEGCIARYEVDGTAYVQVLKWAEHQKIDKPSPSKLPSFDDSSRILANPRELSAMDQEGNGRERKGEEGKSSATPPCDVPHVLTLPLVDGSEHPVTQHAVDDWRKAYPAVDVVQALHQMRAWCIANPTNRKTARGINAFVVRWLAKSQDRAPRGTHQVAQGSFDPDSRQAVEAEGIAKGIGPWNEAAEQWHVYKARVRGRPQQSLDLTALAALAAQRTGVH